MRKIFKFIFILSIHFSSVSQIGTGEWRMHIANKSIDIAAGNGVVFAALETGLLEYDIAANESSLWTNINALSDINITCIYFDEISKSFFVGYQNGNIDCITGSTVTNIPAIKLSQLQGSKSISSFTSNGKFVYASTVFGIVVINTENNEIKDTYYPTNSLEKIQNVVFANDSIYALTPTKLYQAKASNSVLADPNQWAINSTVPVQIDTSYYENLVLNKGEKFLVLKNPAFRLDSIFKITSTGFVNMVNFSFGLEIKNLKVYSDKILLTLDDGLFALDNDFVFLEVYNQLNNNTFRTTNSVFYDSKYYLADLDFGMIEFNQGTGKRITENGPAKNSFFALGGDKNLIAVAGGTLNKTDPKYNISGAYVFNDENWTLFDKYNQSLWTNKNVFDVSSISINPLNSKEIAIGSRSEIPLSISNDGVNISETYNLNNAPFIIDIANKTCISDVQYDSKGNLWIVSCNETNPLKVLTKDKVWHQFYCGSNLATKFSGEITIDYNGNKWFSVLDEGLIGFNDNGTIEDISDDKYIQLNEGENTGALPDANVTAIAVDFDNEIWIGTSNGFSILYNSQNAFEAAPGEYNSQRIKIDFEGNVEYLLGNTGIADIEVDGGNRKWIGTSNAGIFLLSADGLEILESYTTDNSPLISNNIVDMQFNSKTGELFIITDIGLVSLRTNSSAGDSEYKEVIVFPNPVKPDFNGVITIQGIMYDSDVKFTDVSGNLVFQTTSNGGTATWNGKNLKGEKVKAGTYLIWTASNTEKGRKVGKVVILN